MTRINKYIASTGGYSRRSAEKLIEDGRVTVNGKKVLDLATDIKDSDTVKIDGNTINPVSKKVYLMLHKPKGFITTISDEKNRKTVMDFFPDYLKKIVKPVGRLDRDSEGLLLFTNDGEFIRTITHPSSEIEKHYIVKIEGSISKEELSSLQLGTTETINGKDELLKPARVKVISTEESSTRLEVILTEGKNREIRRLFESIGKTIILLKRTQIGSLKLGGLTRGTYKDFDPKHVLKKTK